LRTLVSVVERDLPALGLHVSPGADVLPRFASAVQIAGLQISSSRPAQREDVVDLGSSWAKRLGIPARRPAWLLTAARF
jgi:hypothetical protein